MEAIFYNERHPTLVIRWCFAKTNRALNYLLKQANIADVQPLSVALPTDWILIGRDRLWLRDQM